MPRGNPAIEIAAGHRAGRLTVVRRDGAAAGANGEAMWLCRCDCGRQVRRASSKLRRTGAAHQSCGCLPPVLPADLAGEEYGLWTAIRRAASRGRSTYWLCRCRCGKEREVQATSLVQGRSRSCGFNPCRADATLDRD